MDNRAIARILFEVADLLDIKGDDSFRIRSYRTAGDCLASLSQDVAEMVRRGDDLRSLPGVGAGIASKVCEIVGTGTCAYHRELRAQVPAGLLELLSIPGLGPRGVRLVWSRLGVTSARELEAAIGDGRFRTLPGMKEKKEARILRGLRERIGASRRFLLPEADAAAARLTLYLRERGAERVETAGSWRRRRESIGDLDLIVVGSDPQALSDAFVAHPDVEEVLGHGAAKSSVVLASGLQVDLRPSATESLGAALQYFTGSKAHNVALRERAVRRGLKLNEYGLFKVETQERLAGETEDGIYRALGLAFIPPEMREDRGEIAAAEAGSLPRLVEETDIRGDLHCHTTESDGRDSLEDMLEAARRRGLSYLAFTEHSRAIPSRTRGTGMDEARCLEHIARIRAVQQRTAGFRILAGAEVDILPDGRLDMADDVLAQLDVVVGSLHSRFDLAREAMTERLVRAFENPHLDVWGHPLARLILKRDPVDLDLERVLDQAARCRVAIEVNCQPDRLDLPDHLLRPARDRGLKFVISTDSHSVQHFAHLSYGVAQARRGWLGPDDVLNTRDADGFLSSLRRSA